MRFVQAVGPHCKNLTVCPAILLLPQLRGPSHAPRVEVLPVTNPNYELVITYLLEDVHRFFFPHESMRRSINELSWEKEIVPSLALVSSAFYGLGGPRQDAVFRAFLGLHLEDYSGAVASIVSVLGEPGTQQRQDILQSVEAFLDKRLSNAQRSIFLTWNKRIGVMNCVPGAGKTTVILGLAWAVLNSPANVKLIILEPNKIMCGEARELLASKSGRGDLIARAGLNASTGCDFFGEHLDEVVGKYSICEEVVLAALDRCLLLLMRCLVNAYPMPERVEQPGPRRILALYCGLLAKRHEYLNSVYTAREARREAAALECKVFIMTGSLYQKVCAGQSETNFAKYLSV